MSDSRSESVTVLTRATDQLGDLLEHVHEDRLDGPTPCTEWNLGELADHVVAGPVIFLTLMRGDQPDWSAPPPHLTAGWAPAFRSRADDLVHAWHSLGDAEASADPSWQTAEFAVHSWDLATALGRGTGELDPEVAERGLAFMRANLTADRRGNAFGVELPAPDGADAYQRLASFAGRQV